jgi:hypothetical protein
MTLLMLLAAPAWPVEAALSLALAAGFAAMALHGPDPRPVPDEVTTEAVFASHGWV